MLQDVPTHPRRAVLTRAHGFFLLCTGLAGCVHGTRVAETPVHASGVALMVLEVEPTDEAYALDVARALRRSPSPTGVPWAEVPERTSSALGDELALMEALFFDLDLAGAERAAVQLLARIDNGTVVVEDEALLLRAFIRAAQVFDGRGNDHAADRALERASAVRPGFELSAVEFPPSLLERRARLETSAARVTLSWTGLPEGAHVTVDGSPTRASQVELAAGFHVVRVTAAGHAPLQRAYEVLADQTLELPLEIDPERLHALPHGEAQRYLTLHGAHALRLQVTTTADGRRARLQVPGESSVSVVAPLDEQPAALAARLMTEREAQQDQQADEEVRRRRRRWIASSAAVAVVGAGTGAYFGLRPEPSGWRANGQLGGTP